MIAFLFFFINLTKTIYEMSDVTLQYFAACKAVARFGQKFPENTPAINICYFINYKQRTNTSTNTESTDKQQLQ